MRWIDRYNFCKVVVRLSTGYEVFIRLLCENDRNNLNTSLIAWLVPPHIICGYSLTQCSID